MKFKIFCLLIFILLFTSCSFTEKVQGVEYILNLPIGLTKNGQMNIISDTIPVYYSKKDVIYCLPDYLSSYMNGQMTSGSVEYSYFAFRKLDKYGILYTGLNDSNTNNGNWLLVDSLTKCRISIANTFYIDKKFSLLKVTKSQDGDICKEYIKKSLSDSSKVDTFFCHYSNRFKQIPSTISYKQDRKRKLKLFKITVRVDSYFDKQKNIIFPERQYSYEIRKINVLNPERIMLFFKVFDSTRKTSKLH